MTSAKRRDISLILTVLVALTQIKMVSLSKRFILLLLLCIASLLISITVVFDMLNFFNYVLPMDVNHHMYKTVKHLMYKTPFNFTKEFLYLIQCEECLSTYYMKDNVLGLGTRRDIVALSYKRKCQQKHPTHVKYIMAPIPTTWTSGRNFLYRCFNINFVLMLRAKFLGTSMNIRL